jgi:hypothetical protein
MPKGLRDRVSLNPRRECCPAKHQQSNAWDKYHDTGDRDVDEIPLNLVHATHAAKAAIQAQAGIERN